MVSSLASTAGHHHGSYHKCNSCHHPSRRGGHSEERLPAVALVVGPACIILRAWSLLLHAINAHEIVVAQRTSLVNRLHDASIVTTISVVRASALVTAAGAFVAATDVGTVVAIADAVAVNDTNAIDAVTVTVVATIAVHTTVVADVAVLVIAIVTAISLHATVCAAIVTAIAIGTAVIAGTATATITSVIGAVIAGTVAAIVTAIIIAIIVATIAAIIVAVVTAVVTAIIAAIGTAIIAGTITGTIVAIIAAIIVAVVTAIITAVFAAIVAAGCPTFVVPMLVFVHVRLHLGHLHCTALADLLGGSEALNCVPPTMRMRTLFVDVLAARSFEFVPKMMAVVLLLTVVTPGGNHFELSPALRADCFVRRQARDNVSSARR